MRSATSSFLGQPRSVLAARRWVGAVLGQWGLDATGWSAAQVVSELATNCTLHARTEFTVRLVVDDACLRLEVADASPVALQSRAPSATATTGRGLGIVDVLSVDWGVHADSAGKAVWVLIALDDADTDQSEDASGPTAAASERAGAA